MSFIECRHVTFQYLLRNADGEVSGTYTALDDICLSIESGSFTAIVGANGSGKTTLARHINGLLLPAAGTVTVDGLSTADEEALRRIRQRVGMVFQNPDNQIIADLIEEDVAFGPENLGLPSAEIERRVTEALETVHMSDYRFHSPLYLSGGQKQRVAIAGVLAMRPKCIIFDEAGSMLDPQGREELLTTAQTLHREYGMTILWITHVPEETAAADRMIVLCQGKIAADDSPRGIFSDRELLDRCGLRRPFMAELADTLRRELPQIPETVLTREELVRALSGGAV